MEFHKKPLKMSWKKPVCQRADNFKCLMDEPEKLLIIQLPSVISTFSNLTTWWKIKFTKDQLDRTRSLLNSRWVVKRSSADSDSEKWKCGRLKLTAPRILCKKF